MKNEYEENNYEEISHMIESSLISLGELKIEVFIMDCENEQIKGDWLLPIISKDIF